MRDECTDGSTANIKLSTQLSTKCHGNSTRSGGQQQRVGTAVPRTAGGDTISIMHVPL